MIFLFFHGSFESPNNAWFPWLKNNLESVGHTVIAPQFPVDDWAFVSNRPASEYQPIQHIDAWMHVFDDVYDRIPKEARVSIIGHSLGPVFSLIALQKYLMNISHAYFIAPFIEVYGKSAYIEKANDSFYHQHLNYEVLQKIIPHSTVIYSDNDPYIDIEKSLEFAKFLKSKTIALHGLGHMGSESGMKEFPQLLHAITTDLSLKL